MPELRSYREADLPALHALDQACFPPDIAYSLAELRAFLTHPSSFAALACEDAAILGFAIVRPTRRRVLRLGARVALHLLTIDVAPSARRLGIGTLLMGWVIAQAQRLGSGSITLEVAVDNLPAQSFYIGHGFRQEGVIAGYYNGILDALTMRLDLP